LARNEGKNHIASPKTALVSGAAGGIGYAIAQFLGKAAYRTLIADIKKPALLTENLLYHPTDITSASSIDGLYQFMHQQELVPDLIVCNAGRGITERLAEGDPEKWHSIFNLNVMGHLRLIRSHLPQMLEKQGSTDIVFISSVAARKPHAWGGIYAASKAALQSIAETLRLEVQPKVRVSTILPGVVDTPFFDHMLGGGQSVEEIGWGALKAEDIADAVQYIISRPPGVAINELTIRPAAQPF
jgi:NADP-dependent 3-hydroxy acid dehydrogenase YdfG